MKRPRARRDGLLVQELEGEVVVYDTATATAHCLNRTAALVFQCADGRTSVRDMARRLRAELDLAEEGEAVVRHALARLSRARLLEEDSAIAVPLLRSRRDALRALAGAAALLPAVTTIVAPRAADAATCIPTGERCQASHQCCPNNQNIGCCRDGFCANGSGNCQ